MSWVRSRWVRDRYERSKLRSLIPVRGLEIVPERSELPSLIPLGTWICILALVCLADCRGQAGKRLAVIIQSIEDQASGEVSGGRFDSTHLRHVLEKAIHNSRQLVLTDREKPYNTYRLDLLVNEVIEHDSLNVEKPGVYRSVQVGLALTRWKNEHEREQLASRGRSSQVQDPRKVEPEEGFGFLLEQAIQEAVENIDVQLDTRDLPLVRLRELLESDKSEHRLYVLRALRERSADELMPKVLNLLNDPDLEIVLEAIGVVVAHKEQRAVVPLIRLIEGKDQVFLLQVITALAEIGGPVARGYLFTVASGFTSSLIRERAAEALQQLKQAEKQPQTPEASPKAAVIPHQPPNHSGEREGEDHEL